ncbi:MAG: coproporphyrinogen III oxidase, partial [Lachnospiraceae bacterium]|nr:coproporphyrinogen III oxidase [Lachnospiraceae bacterium]
SIGIQSADDKELIMLGRIHSFRDAVNTVEMARRAGFDNLSVDIMSALPGQTLEKYRENLQKILSLNPEHISAYSLILEEGTAFYDKYGPDGKLAATIPDEDTDRAMYSLTKEMLKEAGYERYEISNYSKPGYESRHNSSYWIGTEYIGFGLGASSLINNRRYANTDSHEIYRNYSCQRVESRADISTKCRILEETLEKDGLMSEFMILGLRMTKGISGAEFREKFGIDIQTKYGIEIDKLISEGILEIKEDRIALTEFGLDVSNYAFEKFI